MPDAAAEQRLLDRAAPYLRRPASHTGVLEIRGGVLDLLGSGPPRRGAEKSFDHPLVARVYAAVRDRILPGLFSMPSFEEEVARLHALLGLHAGDVVLDLACGHGNFTVALAEAVGPEGLVIGVDIAAPMLALAAARVRRAGLRNVLLVRGDAHDLPLADGSLAKLNCSGGFHNMPDLPGALAELARVAAPDARLTASMFAMGEDDARGRLKRWASRVLEAHFVGLGRLGGELARVGFAGYESEMIGAWLGYASARRLA